MQSGTSYRKIKECWITIKIERDGKNCNRTIAINKRNTCKILTKVLSWWNKIRTAYKREGEPWIKITKIFRIRRIYQ